MRGFVLKALGLCLILVCGSASASDFDLRLGIDEVNMIARGLTLPTFGKRQNLGLCDLKAVGAPRSINVYQSGSALKYRVRGNIRFSACGYGATRSFTATGSLKLRAAADGLLLVLGTARVEVDVFGIRFKHTISLPDVSVPVRAISLRSQGGYDAEVGPIGQRMRVQRDTVSVRGNIWVR